MERIIYLNKEFRMINVVVFGKHTKNVHTSTRTMNVAGSKVRLSMHNMPASEASPCARAAAGPPLELEFRARSALKF